MNVSTHKHIKHPLPMPDLEEFYTTQEAAEKLGFHIKSVQNMVKNKNIEGIRVGKIWLVSKKSVNDYLKKTEGMSRNDPRRKADK